MPQNNPVNVRERRNPRVIIWILSAAFLLVSASVMYLVPSIRSGIKQRFVDEFFSYKEVGSIDHILVLFKKDQENAGLFERIENASEKIREKLGAPVFEGKIKIDFSKRLSERAGRMRSGLFWWSARELDFPSENVSDQMICHEIVHGFWQSNGFINNYPLLVTEGMAEAIAAEVCSGEIPLLDPAYAGYYLTGLSGFIKPDDPLPENLVLKNIFYAIAALFIRRLNQTDASVIPDLLSDVPNGKQRWTDFLQAVVDRSAHPDQVLEFVNRCAVFNPVSQHIFAVPVKGTAGEMRSVILYVDLLKTVNQRTLSTEMTSTYRSSSHSNRKLLTFRGGVAETFIKQRTPGRICFKTDLNQTRLETCLPLN